MKNGTSRQYVSPRAGIAFWVLPFALTWLIASVALAQSESSAKNERTSIPPATEDHSFHPTAPEQSLSVRTSIINIGCSHETVCFESRDEIWRISARQSHCCPCDLSQLSVSQLADGCWVPGSLEGFLHQHQHDTSKQTVFYLHGNRTDDEWAISRAAQLYRNLFYQSDRQTPIRFVIWQWKSEVERLRPFHDFQIKAERSVQLGQTLSCVVEQMGDQRLVVMGYSLGAQVILSAVQGIAMTKIEAKPPMQIVFIAPVFHCPKIDCASYSVESSGMVRQTLVFRNECDRIVRIAEKSCQRRTGQSHESLDVILKGLGVTDEIAEYPLAGEIENKHSVVNYTQAPILKAAVNELLESQVR